ncbi:MAG: glycosyltransferase [Candidatus Methylacidiphilales bacterium]|nr:glycosyltransferase [Candidatus Methylacidiphilales bacterium]
MKLLFDHPSPFLLAHGGFQTQIEQTKAALEGLGVEVEYLRWWDDRQTGNIIHYFGRPSGGYIDFAHGKGMKVVVGELHTGLASRPGWQRLLQKQIMRTAQFALPHAFTAKLAWEAYQKADAFIALTDWEKHLMVAMFDADPAKVHVIPNGVEEVFFLPPSVVRRPSSDYLVSTATITPRKRVLELAQAAVLAQVPVWIIGKPYAESDPYHQRFLETVRASAGIVKYEGGISDRKRLAEIYQKARGFVLLSSMESLSLSALEASASGCPLLLADLPWARSSFGNAATYVPAKTTPEATAKHLLTFYHAAPDHHHTPIAHSWPVIAQKFKSLYEQLLVG